MPWCRIDDRLAMSVKIRGLADDGARGLRAKKQRAEALGVWTQVLSWVSGERNDGFVTADILDLFGWPAANARLLRARYGRAPLLHTRDNGQSCECMLDREWPDGYDYLIHDYLDRNPSRSENDVHRAKSKELKNSGLKAAVRERDQDRCRYCGRDCQHSDRVSDAGLTFDHVDPLIADGMSNLVVACRGCNRRKGRRTPEAAGMTLQPEPGADTGPVSGPTPDLSRDLSPDLGPSTGPDSGRRPPPDPATRADVCPDTRDPTQDVTQIASSDRTGRGGSAPSSRASPPRPGPPTAHRIGPPATPRGPLSSSPYTRALRPAPEHHAGVPPAVPPADPPVLEGDL